VQQMVRSLLGLPVCPEPADASDALAVALCHAQASRARERLAASLGRRRVSVVAGGKSSAPRISIPRGR
jgi:Crossover junction endodeoxyribonuclease RuvC